jgi:hypothetical protein
MHPDLHHTSVRRRNPGWLTHRRRDPHRLVPGRAPKAGPAKGRGAAAGAILVTLLALAVVPAPSAPAQSYSLYGDIHALTVYDHLPESEREHSLGAGALVTGHHRLSFDRLDFSAIHRFAWLGGTYADAAAAPPPVLHHVDEAFAEVYLGTAATLRAGKHRMSWGTARTFTPSDSMHPDGSVPSATEGFVGLSGSVTAGPSAGVEAGVAVDNALSGTREFWRDLRYGGRGSLFLFNRLEVAPSLVFQEDTTFRPGLGASVNLGPLLLFAEGAAEFLNSYRYPEVDEELLDAASGDGATGGGDTGGGAEQPAPVILATSFTEAARWEPAYLAAAGVEWSHFFGSVETSVTAEYLFNGMGYTPAERQDLYDYVDALREEGPVPPPAGITGFLGGGALGSAAAAGGASSGGAGADGAGAGGHPLGVPPLVGRHYVLPRLSVDVAGYVSVAAAAAVNLADGSVLGLQRVTVTPTSSFDVSLFTTWAAGTRYESDFGTFPGRELPPGRVRVGADAAVHF